MFVQHMLASLKGDGLMATIMPHGVLFRGGKEKLIRELLIRDDVVEAIISLPQGLFYGTGIPACVLVCNKNKPDALRDKVLFINADREYAEGKNQNKLRPEDIEKIDFVFTHKREIPKYSRLVDKSEIADTHDYNLNIRRYVDNTPEPEPEDVQAHLIGGLPATEVTAQSDTFDKFGLQCETLFQPDRPGYLSFQEAIASKADIKGCIEADPSVTRTLETHRAALEEWWSVARDDFAVLERANHGGRKMPEVRQELLTTLKDKLVPLGVLDEFKSAGVFVNWWQQNRYDLKTIVSTGWHHTLIPDDYLIAAFFQSEANAIEELETRINELQTELAEAVETAQEVAAYEPDEDEKVTATVIKKGLKALIDDLKDSAGASAQRERDDLKAQEGAIKDIENHIRVSKAALKDKTNELELKVQLKRLGGEGFTAENKTLIRQVEAQLAKLDPHNKTDKKKINALNKDKAALQARIAKTDALLEAINGQLTKDEAKRLILKKLYDIASAELERYLNAEMRDLVSGVENLWDKYAVSGRDMERSAVGHSGSPGRILERSWVFQMSPTTQSRPLRDVCTLEKGKPPLQTSYNGPGAERYLTPDFLRGKAEPEYARPSSDAIRVMDGETIILWDGSNAGEILRARNGMLASTMMRVHHNSDYGTGYFYYALKGWENYLKGQTAGSGIPHVDKEIFGALSLFNYQKPEQTKIAEILSTVDQAIDQTEALIAKQQRIKTGLMQDLLTRGIDENGDLRSEETHEFKDSPLGRIPVEWDDYQFGQCVDSAVDGPFGSNLKTEHYVTEPGVRVLRLQNIGNGEFVDTDKAWISEAHAKKLAKHAVEARDLLIGSLGDDRRLFGRACLYPDSPQPAIVKADVFRVRCKNDMLAHGFAFRLFNLPRWRSGLIGLAQGVTRDRVNLSNLMLLRFPVPRSVDEQRAIASKLDGVDAVIVALHTNHEKLKATKTALMQDLLTGKVSVAPLLTDLT